MSNYRHANQSPPGRESRTDRIRNEGTMENGPPAAVLESQHRPRPRRRKSDLANFVLANPITY
jgi:hypothetical protein